jgi:hypothetical protein
MHISSITSTFLRLLDYSIVNIVNSILYIDIILTRIYNTGN